MDITFDQGLCTSRDPADLVPGEMQEAVGIEYIPGDTKRPWKTRGRSLFGSVGTSAEVFGLALCQFDSGGSDYLIAYSGTEYKRSVPGATGVFTSILSGLNASANSLSAAHALDRWYLCNGVNKNQCLEKDGTIRDMCMAAPQYRPVVVTSVPSATVTRPGPTAEISNTGWDDSGSAYDADDSTFASATLSDVGTSELVLGSWAASAASDRVLYLNWSLAGLVFTDPYDASIPETDGGGIGGIGIGGGVGAGFNVIVKFEYSTDAGFSWTTLLERAANSYITEGSIQLPITDDSDQIQIKATLQYLDGVTTATLRWMDTRIAVGTDTTAFTTVTGMYYAVAEYNENAGIQSPPSQWSELVEMSSENIATGTLPDAAQNAATTHYIIYRTPDGGTPPQQLGKIDMIPVSATQFVDDFKRPSTLQTYPLAPMLQTIYRDEAIYVPRDAPAPALSALRAWEGSLCGISKNNPRAYHYSEAGRPESWPEINVITNFPLPEHDILVGHVPVGNTMLIGASGVMLTLSALPRVVNGVFNAAEAVPMDGQPGLVGQNAITAFSVAGEPRGAWVSQFGIHQTNGTMSSRITNDLDWDAVISGNDMSKASLHWDKKTMQLAFSVGSWIYLIHMDPNQQKKNGMPKITMKPGKAVMMVSGFVDGEYRTYSAHPSDGNVYLENNGLVDASQSYSGDTVPMSMKPGKLYGDQYDWNALKGNLRHTDAGAGQAATVTVTMGRDSADSVQVVQKTVSLSGHKGHEFFIARAGEWGEIQVQHTGEARFGILDVRLHVEKAGTSGRVAV